VQNWVVFSAVVTINYLFLLQMHSLQEFQPFRRHIGPRCMLLFIVLQKNENKFNPFKPSGVKWLHFKMFRAILV